MDTYTVDSLRTQILEANRPLRRESDEDPFIDTLEAGGDFGDEEDDEDEKLMDGSDDNNNLSGKALSSLMVAMNAGATDLPTLLSKAGSGGFGLLQHYCNQLLGFGQLSDSNNNNNAGLMSASALSSGLSGSSLASGPAQSLLLAAAAAKQSLNAASGHGSAASSPLSSGAAVPSKASLKPAKISSSKKIWSCGKCATCVAEDCGKCIYCLDRPKFGGPFIKKQRCIKRRCLMKVKGNSAASNKANSLAEVTVNGM